MLDHKLRQLAIGGSDIGAILGCDPDRDGFSVWAAKRGGLERLPDAEKPLPMLLGSMLEEGVIKAYSHVTGRAANYDNKTRRHPQRAYMVYTPDALCRHERRGVDAKVVRFDQRHKWGDTLDDIPMRIVAQCWWYMAAMDYDRWDVAALIGGQDLRIYTADRDLEVEREMLYQAEEFHRRYLAGDEVPPIGTSDEALRWLKQTFPKDREPMLEAAPAEYALLNEYSELRLDQKELGEEVARLEIMIKERIRDAEGIVWPLGRISYRATRDGVETDWKALAQSLMRLATEKEREVIIREYSSPRPGHRRFLWSYDEPAALETQQQQPAQLERVEP
ncbi:MAG TPA: YqaJ viral recombinase family protein [Terracidiphilus sp.]|jgi:predicted phage-related endonuclease